MAANQGIGKKTMLLSAIVDEVSRAPLFLHSVRLHFCSQALLFMKEQPTLAGVTFFNSGVSLYHRFIIPMAILHSAGLVPTELT